MFWKQISRELAEESPKVVNPGRNREEQDLRVDSWGDIECTVG